MGTLYYSRAAGDGNDGRIYSAHGDGTGEAFVTVGNIPHLAPSGKYMAFHRGSASRNFPLGGALWVKDFTLPEMADDGGVGNETLLFASPGDYLVEYSFSLDETKVLFDQSCSVHIIGRDGRGLATFSGYLGCYTDAPTVRPGDGEVAFESDQNGLGILSANGQTGMLIPNAVAADHWPAWTSDGQLLLFQRINEVAAGVPNFYRIHPDGSGLTKIGTLTENPSIGTLARTTDGREVYLAYGKRGDFAALYGFDVANEAAEPVRICMPAGDPLTTVTAVDPAP